MRAIEHVNRALKSLKTPICNFLDGLGENTKTYLCVALCCTAFIAGGVYCLAYEYYWYAAIPLILAALLFIISQFKNAVFLVALFTPFAINMGTEGITLSIPSEPILIMVMLLFVWQLIFSGNYDKRVFSHPISVAIIINILWTLIGCPFSEDVVVSFKYLISQLWFIIPCFFFLVPLFKNTSKQGLFIGLYCFSLCIVVIISSLNFASTGFNFNFAHYAMQPFYNDHTAYGAVIALFIPPLIYYLFYGRKTGLGKLQMFFVVLAFAILVTGFILSYSRSAWISLLAACGIWVIVKLNLKLKTFIYCSLAVLLVVAFSWNSIMGRFAKNEQDSSGNMAEHISSITNISTDASNVERLNRWSCAMKMFKERPVMGWGPGMYVFLYAPYQKSYGMTVISTDAGTLGSTHSEYLRPLAEQGLVGMLTTTAVFVVSFVIGIRAYKRTADKAVANMALFAVMALTTYYVHGFLNQFLETDKLAVPFWGFTAIVAAIDLYAPKKNKCSDKENNIKGRFVKTNRRFEKLERPSDFSERRKDTSN